MILFAVKIEILLDRLHKYNLPDYSNYDHFKIKMGHRYVCQIFLNLQYIKAKSSEVYIYIWKHRIWRPRHRIEHHKFMPQRHHFAS